MRKLLVVFVVLIKMFSCSDSMVVCEDPCTETLVVRGISRVGIACFEIKAAYVCDEKDLFWYKLCSDTPPVAGDIVCYDYYDVID
jgi:hypothetical protein